MKKILILLLVFPLIYSSCKESKNESPKKNAKGGRVYGGTFRLCETEKIQSLFPHRISDVISSRIAGQIYEGLVKFNPQNLSVIPSLAEKWELEANGTTYTFHLKKGVHFHNDPCFPEQKGREMTARDFKFTYELLCTNLPSNECFVTTFKDILAGANKYYEASSKGKPSFDLEGVKVIDDYTLQIILERPNSLFLNMLTHPSLVVIPKEAYEKYGEKSTVGTGAFIFSQEQESPSRVILVRNNSYHGIDDFGNQLPYLDSLVYNFIPSQQAALEEFQKGNLDMLYQIPAESMKEVVEDNISAFQQVPPKYILERSPEMNTQYYDLLNLKGVFKDKKVRQAFSYAIDRSKIVDDVLKGEGYGPGINGISPPSFKDYDISQIKGYGLDVEKARKLLAEAGYPNGANFPKIILELNSGGSRNTNVALEVQKQLKANLNIDIDLNIVSFSKKIEDARYGKSAQMFRAGWVADYPSPQNFLQLFYGKTVPANLEQASYPNTSRYVNPEFDRLFELGMSSKTKEETYKYFMQAEQLAMQDAPVIILWYDEAYRLLQSKVRNFPNNPMQYRDCSVVYFAAATPPKK
jgi:oligopeptide transport system substrate-binding protein